jgi:FKBP-type peptidyl-prolyl cis-trans isomerase FkpA
MSIYLIGYTSKKNFMGKLVICALIGSLLFTSCLKKDSGCGYGDPGSVGTTDERQQLKAYLDSANIPATLSPHGFYYSISQGGSGNMPGQCSQITVSYKGWLTSGVSFETQTTTVFTALGSLIDGWREGIPLIRKGGGIRLYIPPSLGYGSKGITDNSGNIVVPPNSIIIFDISLIDVQ